MGNKAPRTLIEVNGRELCIRQRGAGPAVVLEAGGAGNGSGAVWGEFADRLAASATVLTYDRAGSGRSDGPQHRTVAAMADDLAGLLRATGTHAPVVVVGWSSGGLVAQLFAARHPELVSGVVLADPSVPLPDTKLPAGVRLAISGVQTRVFAIAARLGFFRTARGERLIERMAGPEISPAGLRFAKRQWNDWRELWRSATVLRRLTSCTREASAALRADPPDVPMRLVVPQRRPGLPSEYRAQLDATHAELMRLFPRGELVTAADASHALPLDRPQLLAGIVLDVLRA